MFVFDERNGESGFHGLNPISPYFRKKGYFRVF